MPPLFILIPISKIQKRAIRTITISGYLSPSVDMCGVAGKQRANELNVTVLRPPLATRYNTLCAVGQ